MKRLYLKTLEKLYRRKYDFFYRLWQRELGRLYPVQKQFSAFDEVLWEDGYVSTGDVTDAANTRSDGRQGRTYREIYVQGVLPLFDKDSIVLEIGPGRGGWTKGLLTAREVWVLEAKSLENNRIMEFLGHPTSFRYIQVHDFSCHDLPDDYFDLVFSYGVFVHIPWDGIKAYLANLLPKLKQGAKGLISISDEKKNPGGINYGKWFPGCFVPNSSAQTSEYLASRGYRVLDADYLGLKRDSLILFEACSGELDAMLGRVRQSIRHRLFGRSRQFIAGLTGGASDLSRRALLYYVTEPFWGPRRLQNYEHTMLWEVTEIVRLLNSYGFIVDVVDRAAEGFVPEDRYDLFIGLGAGNSGKHYARYASRLRRAVKVLYAAGPEPVVSNERIRSRYASFTERTGIAAPPMRLVTQVDIDDFMRHTDAIFCFGAPGSFSYQSYRKFNKPLFPIWPGTSPAIRFLPRWLDTRRRSAFLCFAGQGFIAKGVDVLVEAFLKTPGLVLHICGPDSEEAFFEAYEGKIAASPNIRYEGFVNVASKRFDALAADCSYVILNSAKEGIATSVAACMRAGLAPIVNEEVGIEIGNFGFRIEGGSESIENTLRVMQGAAAVSESEYRRRVYDTLSQSLNYTQGAFTHSFSEALLHVMADVRGNGSSPERQAR